MNFLATDPEGRRTLLQVAADLSDKTTRERELRALTDALPAHRRAQAELLTSTSSEGRRSNTTDLSRATKPFAMPVRSSSSSVLVWPDRTSVESALRQWVATELPRHPEVVRLGCLGSFARGARFVQVVEREGRWFVPPGLPLR